ncbi:EAL domain-containing protein [Salinispirillum sp. LH 10-3-1]|uniref:Sensor protein FixL n=1 Tax=Salinispirillum sp. LH 10-3-1 TaxID=2952525 RepID=A0AB38YHW1_9GAMM
MNNSAKSNIDSLYGALVEAAVDGIITIDEQGIIHSFNQAAEKLFGYKRDEVIGQSVNALMPRHYAEQHDEYIENYLKGYKAKIIGIGRDVPGQRQDGSLFPMHLSVGEALTDSGRMFIGVCHDLTGEKKLLLQLARAEKRFKDIVQNQKEMICRLDEHLRLSFVNQSSVDGLGSAESELIGKNFLDLIDENQRAFAQRSLNALFEAGEGVEELGLLLNMSGTAPDRTIDWTFSALKVSEEFGVEIQGYGLDVTDREAAMERAQYLMSHDQLTGLLNRQALLHRFSKQTKRHETYAVLYFDCNHFGLINQKFGHDLGDQLLLIAAQRLNSTLPDNALIARPGGDDFIVVYPVEHSSDTAVMAAAVIEELQEPYQLGEHLLTVRGRVGIAHYPHDGADIDTVIRMAESAIFYRDRLVDGLGFYNPQQQQTLMRTLDIEQRLRIALDLAQLEVYLQPKFTLADSKLAGYEALLRWHDGTVFVSPGEFIPIAESMGLGPELDRYVLEHVCEALVTAQKAGLSIKPIAINITMRHFGHADFCDFLFSCLQKANLTTTLIELEITEGVLMDREDKTQDNLRTLRDRGIRVNIDDFGTGYSSLSYLADLPVDVLKIDRVFVEGLNTAKGLRLVEGIIAMADAMQLDVVAEGIETQEQVNILKSLDCRVGQGFFLGKPQPIMTALNIPKP